MALALRAFLYSIARTHHTVRCCASRHHFATFFSLAAALLPARARAFCAARLLLHYARTPCLHRSAPLLPAFAAHRARAAHTCITRTLSARLPAALLRRTALHHAAAGTAALFPAPYLPFSAHARRRRASRTAARKHSFSCCYCALLYAAFPFTLALLLPFRLTRTISSSVLPFYIPFHLCGI